MQSAANEITTTTQNSWDPIFPPVFRVRQWRGCTVPPTEGLRTQFERGEKEAGLRLKRNARHFAPVAWATPPPHSPSRHPANSPSRPPANSPSRPTANPPSRLLLENPASSFLLGTSKIKDTSLLSSIRG